LTDPAALKAAAQAQDAYGKWNTAPAWNRYYAARRAAQTPLRRAVSDILGGLGHGLLILISLGLLLAPVAKLF
jgi:hypothetical protein